MEEGTVPLGTLGMKMGVIHWAFHPMIGGVESHLFTICPEMRRQGARVYLLTGAVEGEPKEEDILGVKVVRRKELCPPTISGWEKQGKDLYGIASGVFSEFLTRFKIEVVQAHNMHMDFYHYSKALLDCCRSKNVPLYLVVHNDIFMPYKEHIMWQIMELPWNAFVSISDFNRISMQGRRPEMKRRRWVTSKHGIDIDRFKPVSDATKEELKLEYGFAGKRILLHTGRLLHTKGAYETIQALPKILKRFPDTLLVVSGKTTKMISEEDIRNEYEKKVEGLVKEKGLEENIRFGQFLYSEMHRVVALSDVLVSPTVEAKEPFGLSPVEAMACGVPVIVTRSGGLIESVVDGVTGLVIDREPSKIPAQLAQKVIELFSDQGLARKMGLEGRKRAEFLFDKRRMAKDLIELSQDLLDERGRKSG